MLVSAMVDGDVFFGDILLPLLAACLLGGAIGLERELRGRPAGFRTHIMVCLGATMAMLVSMHLQRFLNASDASPVRFDPGRTAAGILTGIGFIGAGAVMKLKSSNRGLTTAACIWFVAALGVVVGAGQYALAIAATLSALAVLLLLSRLEEVLRPHWYRELIVVATRSDDLFPRVKEVLAELGMTVQSYELEEEIEKNQIRALFSVRFPRAHLGEEMARRLREVPGVRTIIWRPVAT